MNNSNTNLAFQVIGKLKDCDSQQRLILTILCQHIGDDIYKKIKLKQKDIIALTGIVSDKVKTSIEYLLKTQYLTMIGDAMYVNTFKLAAMNDDKFLPKRTPYRRSKSA